MEAEAATVGGPQEGEAIQSPELPGATTEKEKPQPPQDLFLPDAPAATPDDMLAQLKAEPDLFEASRSIHGVEEASSQTAVETLSVTVEDVKFAVPPEPERTLSLVSLESLDVSPSKLLSPSKHSADAEPSARPHKRSKSERSRHGHQPPRTAEQMAEDDEHEAARKEALKALTEIENAFAKFREAMYQEKLAEIEAEESAIELG
ncbi:uncharacterized protein EV422DRAFT_249247 [Fimicolochytrium jonesii]|uniref:uncharacterized protein n=1 Tax=Fimicolochytrium jonesii TaxID=1396493 RepID=UPI0022FE1806|nr:uncharacterized protein EV422DRAFT_249247 [Fimicolochytrium jonesii]KAI8825188.1 hypothetical protein EV422DRAFT_249247 [Fimicolochytrium jonesii]